jgi:hypothetical protein
MGTSCRLPLRFRKWFPVHGWSSCWLCCCRCCSGIATCEHILGHPAIRGVPEVVKENIHAARVHAAHVHRRCSNTHGFIRAQEHKVIGCPVLSSFLLVCNSFCQKAKNLRHQGEGLDTGSCPCIQKTNSIHEVSFEWSFSCI